MSEVVAFVTGAITGASLALIAKLLWNEVNWPADSAGCGNHHWGDPQDIGEYRLKTVASGRGWAAVRSVEHACRHHGCPRYMTEEVEIGRSATKREARRLLAEHLTEEA